MIIQALTYFDTTPDTTTIRGQSTLNPVIPFHRLLTENDNHEEMRTTQTESKRVGPARGEVFYHG